MTNRLLHLAPQVILAAGFTAALAVPAMTHQEAQLWPRDMTPQVSMDREAMGHNIPSWTKTLQARYPDCTKAIPTLSDEVIAVHQDASVERLPFASAWALTHDNNEANDIWIVGICSH